MVIERARTRALPKPWGVKDLRPWYSACGNSNPIGEIWYDRSDDTATDPSLLLKLLFTSQPLSIQVHPDDGFAERAGLAKGKTEAWYVLSTAPEAKIALGLSRRLTQQQLHAAIDDGSICDLVVWRVVSVDDFIFVPAGTIYAIGAGLVIAELQQRTDKTFRLFDYGRKRPLHIEEAVAAADTGSARFQVRPKQFTAERRLLVSSPHFVFERVELVANSRWCLEAERETWLLVLSGGAVAGSFDLARGDALFAQSDRIEIQVGAIGMVSLLAYTGGAPIPHLLQPRTQSSQVDVRETVIQVPTSPFQETTAAKNCRLETIK